MFSIGPTELVLVLVLALVIFGPKKLPEMGKAIGNSMREFKKAANDIQKSIELEEDVKPTEAGEKKADSGN